MATSAALPELSFDEEDIEGVIRDARTRGRAAAVLAQIRVGSENTVPSAEGLDTAADVLGEERAQFWVAQLREKGQLATFATALLANGLPIDAWRLDVDQAVFPEQGLADFLNRMRAFRCRVLVGDDVKGSGVLVGPSTVLTAWHVVSAGAPGLGPANLSDIGVQLADGRRIEAVTLPASSPCGDVEWPPGGGRAPRTDDEVKDRHDVALLRLKQPAGIHLSFAALASPAYEYRGPAAVVLISYPEGVWRGVEFAKLRKLRNLTARWGYDVQGTLGGSSGGGCFDTSLRLAGIHQGRAAGAGRLVPLIRFDGTVRQAIADDQTPENLWSLDGTPAGSLVVGRDALFAGYHAAMRGPLRARGLWIRRGDLTDEVSGLPFSFDILDKLVARSPATRLMRVSFDAVVHDLPTEIARRALQAGVRVEAPAAMGGVAADQTEPEAVVADRGRAVAQALDSKLHEMGLRLWVFFDHPAVVFGDESRWALTAFVDQALRLENLRVALAGYEAVQMPGEQFESRFDAEGEGAPGLMVEYLSDVGEIDVRNLIEAAARHLGRSISAERVLAWTAEALKDLRQVNGRYDSAARTQIAARLQPRIQQLSDEGVQP